MRYSSTEHRILHSVTPVPDIAQHHMRYTSTGHRIATYALCQYRAKRVMHTPVACRSETSSFASLQSLINGLITPAATTRSIVAGFCISAHTVQTAAIPLPCRHVKPAVLHVVIVAQYRTSRVFVGCGV
eukprot:1827393-Rhodomonas_salina.1